MKILLVCAGGFSTTMMMDAMKSVVEKSSKLNINDYPMEAIGVDLLENKIDQYDVVLVGPQLNHKYSYIKEVAEKRDKPAVLLDSDIYGKMDGATAIKLAIIAHKKHQLSK
ncbi:PTS sugar transporter subunit IIB [Caldifermentibacillus hisashii]|uniref:PTS sugar transporter subunit IIB n=1 Tax=Caldifermentibacillus hisashii TaxID=996558 RepID=UPI0031FE2015